MWISGVWNSLCRFSRMFGSLLGWRSDGALCVWLTMWEFFVNEMRWPYVGRPYRYCFFFDLGVLLSYINFRAFAREWKIAVFFMLTIDGFVDVLVCSTFLGYVWKRKGKGWSLACFVSWLSFVCRILVLELTYRDTFGSDFCLMMVVPSLFEEVIGCSGTELPYRIIAQLYCSYFCKENLCYITTWINMEPSKIYYIILIILVLLVFPVLVVGDGRVFGYSG